MRITLSRHQLMRLARVFVVTLDALLILSATSLAIQLRSHIGWDAPDKTLDSTLMEIRLPILAAWLVVIALFGGYRSNEFDTGTEIYRSVSRASAMAMGLTTALLFFGRNELSRAYILLLFSIGTFLLLLGRYTARRLLHALYRSGIGARRVLLVGSGAVMEKLASQMRRDRELGLLPVGIVSSNPTRAIPDLPILSPGMELLDLADQHDISLILFAQDATASYQDFRRYLWHFERHAVDIAVISQVIDVATDRVRLRPIAGTPIAYIEGPRSAQALSLGKRLVDAVLSAVGLIMAAPLIAVIALLIRRDGGPIFFRQTRVGREGRTFTMYKLRSMVVDAEQQRAKLAGGYETNSMMFKLTQDPRITPIGHFIRKYSLDELPQLFNVLRGDMSLVGPRPPLPEEVARYTDDEMRRLRVRPGLTGLWQVSGRSNLSWEETVSLDLYYIDNWSALRDLSIMVRTVREVFAPKGSY